ncbi:MAG: prepilin peptidase [Lachnospiraceae bacterium]|nr:prepilin peptidase [Lachnospiraceae bacterium]
MQFETILLIIIFVYGVIIGSFLNVLIYRLPLKENIATERSHCMKCGNKIKWYDLVPLVSYILLRGKCRHCKEKISVQYPLVELANGIGYVWIFYANGGISTDITVVVDSILFCLCTSALLVLSVIDWRTYEIPVQLNIFILITGIARVINYRNNSDEIIELLIGMIAVSVPLLLLFYLTKGRGIGGGDVKLMAAAGLLVGVGNIVLALVLGCVIGSIIHIALMKICKRDNVLAFGPYLSIGIFITMLYGEQIIEWYMQFYS